MTQEGIPAGWPESFTGASAPASAPASAALSGATSSASADPAAHPFMQPFAQSFAGGVDFVKKLWGGLPGSGAVPGFMVPTMDIEELDKRIKDLRTVESWLAMNANMLRATIQGLEVQRNTIAAIQSIGASMSEAAATGHAPEHRASPATGLPPGWPVGAPREHTPADIAEGASAAPSVEAAFSAEPAPTRPAKTREKPAAASSVPPPAGAFPGLSPANWMGYMQDQFSKVAEAALAAPLTRASPSGARAKAAPAKARSGRAPASKKKTGSRGT